MSKHNAPISPLTFSIATIMILLMFVIGNKIGSPQNLALQRSQDRPQDGYVLGEDEQSEDEENEEEEKIEEENKEDSSKDQNDNNENNSEDDDTQVESSPVSPTFAPESIKIRTQNEGNKKETEIETLDGKKIKTKVEDDGSTKIEIEHNRLKIKLEFQNGKFITKAEDHKGGEIELDEQELEDLKSEMEDELEEDGITISTSSAGLLSFAKNQIAATTTFPLSIDIGTNQLVVITPSGQKVVSVLPDKAVQNLLDTGVITALDREVTSDSSVENVLDVGSGVIKFTLRDGRSVYEVKGLKTFKIFGFIPVNQPVTAIASTDDGSLVGVKKSFITNVVDLLSP